MPEQPYPASRTLTILLGKDNNIAWYMGESEKALPKRTSFRLINDVLNQNKQKIARAYKNDPSKFMIVIIKPTKGSTYKNFVDVLDEMSIAGIKSYLIDDDSLLDPEMAYMRSTGLL